MSAITKRASINVLQVNKHVKILNEMTDMYNYNDDYADAILQLKEERCFKQPKTKLSNKEFNRELNRLLNDLSTAIQSEFDTKKKAVIDYALHNYGKLDNQPRPFNEFMSSLRLYIFNLKKKAPKRTQEQRKEEYSKRIGALLTKLTLSNSQYEVGITANMIENELDHYGDMDFKEKVMALVEDEKKKLKIPY